MDALSSTSFSYIEVGVSVWHTRQRWSLGFCELVGLGMLFLEKFISQSTTESRDFLG